MRNRDWERLLKQLDELTRGQRQRVLAELAAADEKASSISVIEGRAPLSCPHCGGEHVVKNGSADGLQRYKCRGCQKTFNTLTGSPLAGLHLRDKWLQQATVLSDGLSLTKAMARLNVSRSTAFRWRHRFLALPKTVRAQALIGIAEGDETFFLRSSKGQRKGLGRSPRKRGGKAEKRELSDEQVPILVARDRAGSTADFILAANDAEHIADALKPILAKDAILCTDGSKAMKAAARKMNVMHRPVNLSAGIRVIVGVYHVQNVNAYDSRLKGWLRQFKGVATRYLDSCLGWFRAIDRTPGGSLNPASLLASAVRT